MATIAVWPQEGREFPDANNVPITSAGAVVAESTYIKNAVDAGYLLDWDPLNIYDPEDRTNMAPRAPGDGSYITVAAEGELSEERVLTAGTGISIVDGGPEGPITISATGGVDAPIGAQYLTVATDATLPNERALAAGSGLAASDSGAGGVFTMRRLTAWTNRTTSFALTVADSWSDNRMNGATPLTVTLPNNTSQPIEIGTEFHFWNYNVGGFSLVAEAGATIEGGPTTYGSPTASRFPIIRVVKAGTNSWFVGAAFVGPTASNVDAIPRFSTTTGERLSNSGVTIDSSNNIVMPASATVDGVDVSALAAVPFVTIGNTATVANERALTAGSGISITDGGAGGNVTVAQSVGFNTQATTAYTLTLSDAWTTINFTLAGTTVTVPNNSTTAFPIGTKVWLRQGTGSTASQVSVVGAGGVNVVAPGGFSAATAAIGSVISLQKTAVNDWIVGEDMLEATQIVTMAAVARYPNERVLTAGAGISITDGGAGGAVTVANNSSIIDISSTTYTFVLADAGKTLFSRSNSAVTVTVPAGVFPSGTRLYIWQFGTGQVTVSGAAFTAGSFRTRTQHSRLTLYFFDPNNVQVSGDFEDSTSYVTLAATAAHPNERVLTAGAGISITDGGAGGAVTVANNSQTDIVNSTTYTVVAADDGRTKTMNAGTTMTVTLPTTGPGTGGVVYFIANNADVVFVAGAGASIQVPANKQARTSGRFALVRAYTVAGGTSWYLNGDLAGESANLLIANAPGTQSVASGGGGDVVQWTETTDTGNNFAANVYTAPFTGYYSVNVYTAFNAGTGSGLLRVRVGGGTLFTVSSVPFSGAGTGLINSANCVVFATAGGSIDFTIIQNTGANQTIQNNSFLCIRPLSN